MSLQWRDANREAYNRYQREWSCRPCNRSKYSTPLIVFLARRAA